MITREGAGCAGPARPRLHDHRSARRAGPYAQAHREGRMHRCSPLLPRLWSSGGAGRVDPVASPKSGLRSLTGDTECLCDLHPGVVGLPCLIDHLGQDFPRFDFDGRQSSDGNQRFLGDSQQVRGFGCCRAEVQRVERVSIRGTVGHRPRLLPIAKIRKEQVLVRQI